MFKYFSVILISVSFLWAITSHAEEEASSLIDYDKPAAIDEEIQLSAEKFADLERRSEEGDMRAMAELGFAYMIGNGVEADPDYAKVLLQVSANSGDTLGLNNLAAYYNFLGTDEELFLINPLYKKAADLGEASAAINLGRNLYLGAYGQAPDYKKAKKYLLIGAKDEAFASLSNYYLGLMAYFGRGEKEDKQKAVKLIRAAAEAGNWDAQFDMGGFYETGNGVEKDAEVAHEWYVAAALNEHGEAAWNVGLAYVFGEVVEKNSETAVNWFRVSAALGHPRGYTSLGVMYATGDGVPQSFEKAYENYYQAALRGEGHAARIIGSMYLEGQYVEEDQYQSAVWFEIAVYLKGDDALENANTYREINSLEVMDEIRVEARKWLDDNGLDYDQE